MTLKNNFMNAEKFTEDVMRTKYTAEANGEKFNFDQYLINPKEDSVIAPLGIMPEDQETLERYSNLPLVHKIIPGIPVPFTFLHQEGNQTFGNYTNTEGQREFSRARAHTLNEHFSSRPDIAELWEFSQRFKRNFPFDSVLSGLRSLNVENGKLEFGIAPCKYSRFFYTNRADGIRLDLSQAEQEKWIAELGESAFNDLMKKAAELKQQYPGFKTIGEIIKSKYPDLPSFNEHTRGDAIGVAGIVLTQDGHFIFVNRGKNVAINHGINCTASGSVDFDENLLSTSGIQGLTGNNMIRETEEELGFKAGNLFIDGMSWYLQHELGFNQDDFDAIPVGFLRELRQGASPESMFLIRHKGTVSDVISAIKNNKHEEGKEIDRLVYALPQEDAGKLILTPGATSIIQNKGLVNLMLIMEYLKNFSK